MSHMISFTASSILALYTKNALEDNNMYGLLVGEKTDLRLLYAGLVEHLSSTARPSRHDYSYRGSDSPLLKQTACLLAVRDPEWLYQSLFFTPEELIEDILSVASDKNTDILGNPLKLLTQRFSAVLKEQCTLEVSPKTKVLQEGLSDNGLFKDIALPDHLTRDRHRIANSSSFDVCGMSGDSEKKQWGRIKTMLIKNLTDVAIITGTKTAKQQRISYGNYDIGCEVARSAYEGLIPANTRARAGVKECIEAEARQKITFHATLNGNNLVISDVHCYCTLNRGRWSRRNGIAANEWEQILEDAINEGIRKYAIPTSFPITTLIHTDRMVEYLCAAAAKRLGIVQPAVENNPIEEV